MRWEAIWDVYELPCHQLPMISALPHTWASMRSKCAVILLKGWAPKEGEMDSTELETELAIELALTLSQQRMKLRHRMRMRRSEKISFPVLSVAVLWANLERVKDSDLLLLRTWGIHGHGNCKAPPACVRAPHCQSSVHAPVQALCVLSRV